MDPNPFRSALVSRRRVLSLAAGATALAVAAAPARRLGRPGHAHRLPGPRSGHRGHAGRRRATAPRRCRCRAPWPPTPRRSSAPWSRRWWRRCRSTRSPARPSASWPAIAKSTPPSAWPASPRCARSRPETLFQIGSLTKTYTGTAIWHLIDAGALALDAPVRTYLPELTLMDETAAAEVTVANLLDHSAGWYGDEGFDTGDDDGAIARYVAERLPQLPQLFPLGSSSPTTMPPSPSSGG